MLYDGLVPKSWDNTCPLFRLGLKVLQLKRMGVNKRVKVGAKSGSKA